MPVDRARKRVRTFAAACRRNISIRPDRFDSATLRARVVIIGAGVAGIAAASILERAGIDCILVEGGGNAPRRRDPGLARGEQSGMPFLALDLCRARGLGGTANLWGGRCAELNEVDFERRDWVAYSGWPFGLRELQPHYDTACRFLGINPGGFGADTFATLGRQSPLAENDVTAAGFWQQSSQMPFADQARAFCATARHVRLLTHSSATNLELDGDGTRIVAVEVRPDRPDDGAPRRLVAEHVVLACGAIENARLLLASNRQRPAGIGNEHDLVGRFFMDHPHVACGVIDGAPLELCYSSAATPPREPVCFTPHLRTMDDWQRRHRALNASISLEQPRAFAIGLRLLLPTLRVASLADHPIKLPEIVAPHDLRPLEWTLRQLRARVYDGRLDRQFVDALIGSLRHPSQWGSEIGRKLGLRRRQDAHDANLQIMYMRAEQVPDPENRVTLGQARDRFGSQVPHLRWQLGEQDRRSAMENAAAIMAELEAQGLGRITPRAWCLDAAEPWPPDVMAGLHHMGTTRMAAGPRQGVVTPDGRVHGVKNLFITGGSVFPTGGWANPTLTIAAMAIRLGCHLAHLLAPPIGPAPRDAADEAAEAVTGTSLAAP
jgi:choline dehydrogenase-like flavoprotein